MFITDWHESFYKLIDEKNVLASRKGKKLDLTSFKDNVPEHSVDLHAACPRCLAAEASKPGAKDGEFVSFYNLPSCPAFFIVKKFIIFSLFLYTSQR